MDSSSQTIVADCSHDLNSLEATNSPGESPCHRESIPDDFGSQTQTVLEAGVGTAAPLSRVDQGSLDQLEIPAQAPVPASLEIPHPDVNAQAGVSQAGQACNSEADTSQAGNSEADTSQAGNSEADTSQVGNTEAGTSQAGNPQTGTSAADNPQGVDPEPSQEHGDTTASRGILPRVHDAPVTASNTEIPCSGVSRRSGLSPAPVRPPELSVSHPTAVVRGHPIPLDDSSVEAPPPPLSSPPVAHLPQPPGSVAPVEAAWYHKESSMP